MHLRGELVIDQTSRPRLTELGGSNELTQVQPGDRYLPSTSLRNEASGDPPSAPGARRHLDGRSLIEAREGRRLDKHEGLRARLHTKCQVE